MADVWYQNLEKSFKINKNIDRAFFSVDNTPKSDKTKYQLSFATDCISRLFITFYVFPVTFHVNEKLKLFI